MRPDQRPAYRVLVGVVLLLVLGACAPARSTAPVLPAAPSASASVPRVPSPASTRAASTPRPTGALGVTPPPASGSPSATLGTPTPVRPASPATPSAVAVLPATPALPATPTLSTAHYRVYDVEGTHATQLDLLRREADRIYATVAARTGLTTTTPIVTVIQSPVADACAARGIAYVGDARIGLFLGAATTPAQVRAVLAHETAHILHFAAVQAGVADATLAEGFANWAARPYWSAWQGYASFEDAVRAYLADSRFVALDVPLTDCTIVQRDVVYNERASFVGYLIAIYGMDRFLAASATRLPAPGSSSAFSADYTSVYGKSFAALSAEWLNWVRAGHSGT